MVLNNRDTWYIFHSFLLTKRGSGMQWVFAGLSRSRCGSFVTGFGDIRICAKVCNGLQVPKPTSEAPGKLLEPCVGVYLECICQGSTSAWMLLLLCIWLVDFLTDRLAPLNCRLTMLVLLLKLPGTQLKVSVDLLRYFSQHIITFLYYYGLNHQCLDKDEAIVFCRSFLLTVLVFPWLELNFISLKAFRFRQMVIGS